MWQMKHVQKNKKKKKNKKKRKKKKRKEMYLKLRFIKQNGMGD